jgi:hypothetical protein
VSLKQDSPCQLISIHPPENLPHDYTSSQPAAKKTYNSSMNTVSMRNLRENTRGGGKIQRSGKTGWRLEIPPGNDGKYRLAQLDDYRGLARSAFPWSSPMRLSLAARASSRTIPGTWGFGLWNDPFGMALLQGSNARFPALPNAAWFFFASEANCLSLRDDLPANGQMAATFNSPSQPSANFLLRLPIFSLIFLPPVARWLRSWLRKFIEQDTAAFDLDPTEWHTYELKWEFERLIFRVDGQVIQATKILPRGPLGLVIWVDNQFASWLPDGHIGYGTLSNRESAWLQIDDLALTLA